jgi:MFS transporter, DHA1 family, multidrug resistance protein
MPQSADFNGAAPVSRPISVLVPILASLTAFAPLSIDMYLPSFPKIAEEFVIPDATVELSLASFFVGLAIGQLFYGTATDRFGRKQPLYVGLTIYFIASIICAFSRNIEILIVARFFQALGACGGIVIARAMVRDLFDHQESARVFSLLMLVMGVAPILAPLIGGYVALFFGWRAIFFVVAAVSLAVLAAVIFVLPETKAPNREVTIGNTFQNYWRILKDREFLGFTLTGGFAQAGLFAYITGSPFIFINIFGVPSEQFGWVFGANAVGLIGFSQLNGKLLRTRNPDDILRKCLIFTAIFCLLLIAAGVLNLGFWGVAIPLFMFVASLGMVFPNSTAGALSKQGAMAGTASALLGSLQYALAAVSSTLVSSLNNGTTLPTTALIGGSGILTFLTFTFLIARKRDTTVETV